MTQAVTHFEVPTANGAFRLARIAFVQSGWHSEIVDNAYQGFLKEIGGLGFSESAIDRFEVPGAFEIPLHAKRLALSGSFDAIIACGLVVNGGVYRHEFVAAAVIDGLMRVQLDCDVPVFSAVLTPRDFHEHDDHHRFFREHFVKKGTEVARACLETLASLRAMGALTSATR